MESKVQMGLVGMHWKKQTQKWERQWVLKAPIEMNHDWHESDHMEN